MVDTDIRDCSGEPEGLVAWGGCLVKIPDIVVLTKAGVILIGWSQTILGQTKKFNDMMKKIFGGQ